MIRNKEWRDAVATRAFYTSQTQRCDLNRGSRGSEWVGWNCPLHIVPSTEIGN
jgi:hypothetical protein